MSKISLSNLSSYAGLTIGFVMFLGLAGFHSDAKEPRSGARSALGQSASSQGEQKMTLQITSAAFTQGHPIPKKYTGEGDDVSPPLGWSGLPEGTKELALICDDPTPPRRNPGFTGSFTRFRPMRRACPRAYHESRGSRNPTASCKAKTRGPPPRPSATAARCLRRATACIITTLNSTRWRRRSRWSPEPIRKPSRKRCTTLSWPRAY